jgi:hypothetical protein
MEGRTSYSIDAILGKQSKAHHRHHHSKNEQQKGI